MTALIALLACQPPAPVEVLAELPPQPAPTSVEAYAWLEGHWAASDGSASETWVAVDEALVGVGFIGTGDGGMFEVLRIDAEDGVGYTAWPAGREGVRFPARGTLGAAALFALPEHDWPQEIRYEPVDDRLDITLSGPKPQGTQRLSLLRGTSLPAPALEEADRAAGLEPLASGVSADGRLGFTIGRDDAGAYAAVRTRAASGAWMSTFERHWQADRPPGDELAGWVQRVQAAFLGGFEVPATLEDDYQAAVEVIVDAKGNVTRWTLVESSGHTTYDEVVGRAVAAVKKVPAPPPAAVDRPLLIRYVYP